MTALVDRNIQIQNVTEGINTSEGLPWAAYSVIVDNFSNSWLYVVEADRFIKPWTYGATIMLQGCTSASILWTVPNNFIAPVITPGALLGGAKLYWTNAVVAPTEGTYAFPTITKQQVLGTTVNGVAQTFTLPNGTQFLGILPSSNLNQTTIQGVQSGLFYAIPVTFSNFFGGIEFSTVAPDIDSQVSITTTTNAKVIAFFTEPPANIITGVVTVRPDNNFPLLVIDSVPLTVKQATPPIGNILGGYSQVTATTVITIPAGATWVGTVWLVGIPAAAAGFATITISTGGVSNPVNGTVLAIIRCGAAITDGPMAISIPNVTIAADATHAINLVLAIASLTAASGGVNGVIFF